MSLGKNAIKGPLVPFVFLEYTMYISNDLDTLEN